MKKLALVWNHFDPEEIYLIKGDAEKIDGISGYGDWYVEDVTDINGLCLVSHNDESCGYYKMPCNTIEEVKTALTKELKDKLEDSRRNEYDEDEYELDSLGGYYEYVEDTNISPEKLAEQIFQEIDDSYVDNDSSSKYEFMEINEEQAAPFEEIFGEEEDY